MYRSVNDTRLAELYICVYVYIHTYIFWNTYWNTCMYRSINDTRLAELEVLLSQKQVQQWQIRCFLLCRCHERNRRAFCFRFSFFCLRKYSDLISKIYCSFDLFFWGCVWALTAELTIVLSVLSNMCVPSSLECVLLTPRARTAEGHHQLFFCGPC